VAREASQRLGTTYVIQYEEALYKVRLGSFASEEEAQALREKAVQGGFPGAFRVRTVAGATGSKN
jgi:cell division septation protein DedD